MKRKNDCSVEKCKLLYRFKKQGIAWAMLIPFLACLILFIWLPNIQGIILSFFNLKGYEPVDFCGLKNYEIVIKNTNFMKTLWNTIQYVLWSVVVGYLVPIALAIVVNELRRMSGVLKFVYYLPAMVPTIAVSMLWYYIYYGGEGGLLNMLLSFFGVAPVGWLYNANTTILMIIISVTWKGFGATMLIYLAALQGIDKSLYEAAAVDGASVWHRIRYITIPEMSGILMLNFIRQIIAVFQIVQEPLTMTGGGPNGASATLGLLAYNYAFKYYKIGNSLATNVIMLVILMVLTFVYQIIDKKYSDDV